MKPRVHADTWCTAADRLGALLEGPFEHLVERIRAGGAAPGAPLTRLEVEVQLRPEGLPAIRRAPRHLSVAVPRRAWPVFCGVLRAELKALPHPVQGALSISMRAEDLDEVQVVEVACVVASASRDQAALRIRLRDHAALQRHTRELARHTNEAYAEMRKMFDQAAGVVHSAADVVSAAGGVTEPVEPEDAARDPVFELVRGLAPHVMDVLAGVGGRDDGAGGWQGDARRSPGDAGTPGKDEALARPRRPAALDIAMEVQGQQPRGDGGGLGGDSPTEPEQGDVGHPTDRREPVVWRWRRRVTWVGRLTGGPAAVDHVTLTRTDASLELAVQSGERLQVVAHRVMDPETQFQLGAEEKAWAASEVWGCFEEEEQGVADRDAAHIGPGPGEEAALDVDITWEPQRLEAWSAPVQTIVAGVSGQATIVWRPGQWVLVLDRGRPSSSPPAMREGPATSPGRLPDSVRGWAEGWLSGVGVRAG